MTGESPKWRITVSHFLMLAALAGLLVGVASAGWRAARREHFVAFCVSPNGQRVALATTDGRIQAWDLSGIRSRRMDTGFRMDVNWTWGNALVFTDAQTIALFRDGTYTGSPTSSVEKWSIASGRMTNEIQLRGLPNDVLFAADGSTFAAHFMANDTIEVWDLDTGKPLRTVALKMRAADVLLSGDGTKLLVTDAFRTTLNVYDARSGNLDWAMRLKFSSLQIYPSAQGKWIATVRLLGAPGADYRWLVEVYDVARKELHSKFTVDDMPTSLVFDPQDERLLCVHDGEDSQLFDIDRGAPIVKIDDGLREGKSYAFTSDGDRLVGLSRRQLAFWNTDTGRRARMVWRNRATLNAMLFGTAFAMWAAGWGWLARRSRPLPISQNHPTTDQLTRPLPPPPGAPEKQPPSLARSLCHLAVILAFVMVLATLLSTGPVWRRIAVGLGGTVGIVAGVFLVVIVYVVVRDALSRGFESHLSRAVKVAGRQGRAYEIGRYAVWFAGQSMMQSDVPDEIARTEKRLQALVGPYDYQRPGFIVVFDDHDQFQRYVGRRLRLGGVFFGWPKRQLAVSEAYCVQVLAHPVHILRSLLGYHLLLECKGFWLPPWVQAVVNAHLMAEDTDVHAVRCAHRRLRLALNQGRLSIDAWMSWSRRQMAKAVLQSDPTAASRETLMALDMAQSLAVFLLGSEAGDRRDRFGRFVRELERRGSVEGQFREHLGCGFDELVNDWKVWLLRQETVSFELPPPWRHRQLVEHTLPALRDTTMDAATRTRQILSLGAAGYLATVECLVERLRQPDEPQRAEVVASLEQIAGEPLGDDADAWRQWCERQDESSRTLPPLVLDDPTTPSVNAMQCPPGPSVVAPPPGVLQARTLMCIGGLVAIVLAMLTLFEGGLWWMPTIYYGTVLGVVAIARAIGCYPRGMRVVAGLQIANLVGCDLINLVLGIVQLILLRDPAVKAYLNGPTDYSSAATR